MKRDWLRNLGITDEETINQIMDENGKDVNREKAKADLIQESLNNATKQLEDRAKDIENLQKSSVDNSALTKQLDELQEKYNTDTANFQKQLAERDYDAAIDKKLEGISFSSLSAKRAFKAELKASGRVLKEDGEIEGFDEFFESQKKSDPDAFRTAPKVFTQGKTSETPPASESAAAKHAREYSSKFTKSIKE